MNAYFYIDKNNAQRGPVAGERLLEFGVTPETPVWCEGMADWMPAETVDELKPLFQQQPPQFGQQQYRYQQPYNQNRQYGYNPQQPVPEKPDSWLAWSILCTIMCCLPLGVVGIVYAAQVDSLWNQGKFAEAMKSAKKAKTFTLIGVISAAVFLLIYFLFWFFAVALGIGAASMAAEGYYY